MPMVKWLFTVLAILIISGSAISQESKIKLDSEVVEEALVEIASSGEESVFTDAFNPGASPELISDPQNARFAYRFNRPRSPLKSDEETNPLEKFPVDFPVDEKKPNQYNGHDRFPFRASLAQSGVFLAIQHSLRLFQKKTRDELGGPFFSDWGSSVKNLGRWKDGDGTFTNYVAHPMQGAVTGRIFINNSDRSKRQEFGKSREYWESRFKAMAWSAVWSTQFEIGPISEASIGNVGLYDRVGPNRMGWVDLVITPTAGTTVLVGEDIIDKYILRKWLERKSSRARIRVYRTFFTPFQSFTNVLRGKVPWKRDNR